MAPAVPSLRVQRLEELQRQQSIELQQILLRPAQPLWTGYQLYFPWLEVLDIRTHQYLSVLPRH